ncbi:MAG: co-chaperone GroES [Planctomycetes bacterium]|nr:co-chaperone GroES [Planctomycetota bacterium]
MNLRPLEDHVVVKPLEAEAKTAGGIILPDTAREKSTKGEVVAVGKGKLLPNGKRVEPQIKAGDKVIYGKYSGTDVKLNANEYKIVKESEILAIIA